MLVLRFSFILVYN